MSSSSQATPILSRQHMLQTLRHNPLIPAFYIPALLFAICQGMLVPIMPLFARSLADSYGLIGLVLAGESLGRLVGDIPAGILLRRFDTRNGMLLGFGCIVVGMVATIGAHSIVEVFFYRVLTGFGVSLFAVARHAYIAAHTTPTNRGKTIASLGGVVRTGVFVGPLIAGVIASVFDLRAPFVVYVGFCLITICFIARYVQPINGQSHEAVPPPPTQGNRLWATLKAHYRIFLAAGAGQLFAQMLRKGRQDIVPLFAADVLGLGVLPISLVITISSLVDMLMFYPAGMIMDRRGRKYAIVPTFFVQALGMALVPFTLNFGGLLVATCVMGFANGLSAGTMMTVGADLAPPETRGEFLGIWQLIGDTGVSGSPIIVGGVADWLTLGPAAWVLAGAGLLAAGIFAFFVPETLKLHPSQQPV